METNLLEKRVNIKVRKNGRKIYTIGSGANDCGYSNWLLPTGFTNRIEEADICLGLGGSDVSAHYYNEPDSGRLWSSPSTDKAEYHDFKRAIELKKPIVGTCKGLQWINVLAGGTLFQDVRHPGRHEIETYDGKILVTNSLHHNMCNISKLKENEDYKLLAWANSLSPYHFDGYNVNLPCEKEPEVVYYPKIRAIGWQGHNEMAYRTKGLEPLIDWSQNLIQKFLNDKI